MNELKVIELGLYKDREARLVVNMNEFMILNGFRDSPEGRTFVLSQIRAAFARIDVVEISEYDLLFSSTIVEEFS